MSLVVKVARVGLARSAKVRVGADGALVPDAGDVRDDTVGLAEGAIAADALMDRVKARAHGPSMGERLVDGSEAVAGMVSRGVLDALAAVVPIRAVKALVTNSPDELVTLVADGVMG